MELNLHIIGEDLKRYRPQSRIEEDYGVRRLRFPALFDGNQTKRSLLYIVESGLLTPDNIELVTEQSSLLIIGKPPSRLLKKHCNLVWIEKGARLSQIFSEVVELFSTYETWSDRMLNALISKKQLKRLGELAGPVVKRPLYLIDSHLQMLFSVVDRELYQLPRDYLQPSIDNNNPALGVFALDRFYDDALTHRKPFLLPENRSYRTLVQNIFVDSHLVATLSFDEVGGGFTQRDYALIVILAEFIANGISYHDEWNTSAPQLLDEQIHLLLDGRQPNAEELSSALRTMGWMIEESYYCIVATPLNPLYPSGLLAANARHACAQASHMIYAIYDHTIIFIVNADHATFSHDEIVELVTSELDRLLVQLGVSNIFNGFAMLGVHCRLARAAQQLGSQQDPDRAVYRFQDYFLAYLVARVKESTPLEAIIPRGLLQLKRYDEKYGTDFVHVFRVFLKNDMRIASAARELFLHRNTLSHKISQIKFITRLDFENDPDVRLSALIALNMME
ncbi:MAG: helix-turn-helix domain-containing protein [Coriobacteriales bacterium]|jgi:sugar diacid utilization regulator|nr:helix-turn-helix domain-containing protein [Coriobacteriales bacterium]